MHPRIGCCWLVVHEDSPESPSHMGLKGRVQCACRGSLVQEDSIQQSAVSACNGYSIICASPPCLSSATRQHTTEPMRLLRRLATTITHNRALHQDH